MQTHSTIYTFGTEHNWPDSAKISISAPTAYTLTASGLAGAEASGFKAGTPVELFTITYTNEQKAANSAYLDMTIKGGMFIADLDNPAGNSFDPPIQLLKTGQSVTWTEAYSVPDPTSFSVLVGPGFGATPVTFSTK